MTSTSIQLIDSHCHLNYDYLPKTNEDLIREAEEVGVIALVTIGTDIPSIGAIQAISEKFENVYHSIGVHPHDAVTLNETHLPQIESAARHPKCRAIGEIGLDYHYDHSPREIQIARLEEQLDIALKLKKPVIIHSREGEEDLWNSLEKYSKKVTSENTPGIIHCFSGSIEFGKRCLDAGFYISFSGILTFKKADEIRTAAKLFPLEKILVETDSPYLAPVPFRGKKCEPKMVLQTAQTLAQVKNLELEEVARVTTENSKRVFQI